MVVLCYCFHLTIFLICWNSCRTHKHQSPTIYTGLTDAYALNASFSHVLASSLDNTINIVQAKFNVIIPYINFKTKHKVTSLQTHQSRSKTEVFCLNTGLGSTPILSLLFTITWFTLQMGQVYPISSCVFFIVVSEAFTIKRGTFSFPSTTDSHKIISSRPDSYLFIRIIWCKHVHIFPSVIPCHCFRCSAPQGQFYSSRGCLVQTLFWALHLLSQSSPNMIWLTSLGAT